MADNVFWPAMATVCWIICAGIDIHEHDRFQLTLHTLAAICFGMIAICRFVGISM